MRNIVPFFSVESGGMRGHCLAAAVCFAATLPACSGNDDAVGLPDNAGDAVLTYADIVEATYTDTLTAAEALDEAVTAFVVAPSQKSLTVARDAWLASREPYLQTEVFRFYDGPIDNPIDGPEGMLNAWPLDEAYVDYVDGDADAGIVNDPKQEISATELEKLNEQGGEENIATGYHAVEFLLWGQDHDADGPGDRPFTDFVVGKDGSPSAKRRGEYLQTVSQLLTTHLRQVREQWANEKNTYRRDFEAAAAKESLTKILTGMIVLTGFETGGERLQRSLNSGDQEDEHSCFSDNTHRDMIQDVQGVKNVWRGSYTRLDGKKVNGTSVRAVVQVASPELADELDAQIDASLDAAKALQPPFDREIAPGNKAGRKRLQTLIEALGKQEELLQDVFQVLGFTVTERQRK
ncbi:MAG: hypothetical protein RJA70_2803 [Pseudomonadota bacterium]|jgi:putative iron-regulated protein